MIVLIVCNVGLNFTVFLSLGAVAVLVESRTKNASRIGYASGGTMGFARTRLGLCSPAPARDREQEEQRGTVKESRIRDRNAARSTHVGRIHVKSSCQSKDQRESSADQPEPITYE